jgi:hypothetical protein
MGGTFVLALFGWILFRAESLAHAVGYVKGMLKPSLFDSIWVPEAGPRFMFTVVATCFFTVVMFLFEWLHRDCPHALCLRTSRRYVRYMVYIILLYVIWIFRPSNPSDFIYFQF